MTQEVTAGRNSNPLSTLFGVAKVRPASHMGTNRSHEVNPTAFLIEAPNRGCSSDGREVRDRYPASPLVASSLVCFYLISCTIMELGSFFYYFCYHLIFKMLSWLTSMCI
ncbi:Uncharacterized protein TCM_013823 [Theobroma cacao]|uniref:Uncharacterized protein n=1 Tax=Theobroma cacao TaxID=3641 RepID=A0A061FXF3_THECC|nr:Uncharacterized protein TCM_013823 [Theobroma cacao]